MKRALTAAVLLLAALAPAAPAARAQEAPAPAKKLVVGIKPAAPFVNLGSLPSGLAGSGPTPSGFSVELIGLLAAKLDPPREIELRVHPDLETHLEAVRKGEVDLGIAATSVSAERERTLDFSLPFFFSGLDIAVKPGEKGALWDLVVSPQLFTMLGVLAGFVLVCAVLIWAMEHGSDSFDDRPIPGIAEGIWWTIVTMSTVGYGDFAPKKLGGRILAIVVIFAGIILVGVAIGVFSSALTVQTLKSDITGPEDLQYRTVAVVQGTTAQALLVKRGINVLPKASLAEALAAVESGAADAAVADAPQLQYHFKQNETELRLVGKVFAQQSYAITFPIDSELRKPFNVALLDLMEGDPSTHQLLVKKWFGQAE